MNKMKAIIQTMWLIVILSYNALLVVASDIKIVRNSLPEINSKLEKIFLQPVRTWGDEDEEGHYFKTPTDIAVDSKNQVYIVDSALHCIKVFDSNGRFIRTIAKRGQGPGTVLTPMHIGIDTNNLIWVFESGNRRIQTFSDTGTSLSIFKTSIRITSNLVFLSKNQIALYDSRSAKNGNGIITEYDRTGTRIQKIGMHILPPQVNLPWRGGKYDSHNISYNNKTQEYYVSYKYSQMIQVFQKTGALTACIFYETPINSLELSWRPKRENYDIVDKKKYYSKCVDSDIDDKGRHFIVATTRLPKENERTNMVFYPGGTIAYKPIAKNYPEETDMLRLMVFGTDGKILAAKQLNVFCDGIYLYKNRIFIIDRAFAQVIYEYEYTIKNEPR